MDCPTTTRRRGRPFSPAQGEPFAQMLSPHRFMRKAALHREKSKHQDFWRRSSDCLPCHGDAKDRPKPSRTPVIMHLNNATAVPVTYCIPPQRDLCMGSRGRGANTTPVNRGDAKEHTGGGFASQSRFRIRIRIHSRLLRLQPCLCARQKRSGCDVRIPGTGIWDEHSVLQRLSPAVVARSEAFEVLNILHVASFFSEGFAGFACPNVSRMQGLSYF